MIDRNSAFKVWIDGDYESNIPDTDFGTIHADGMPQALDLAAQMAGYIDHSDLCQEMKWEESELNIAEA